MGKERKPPELFNIDVEGIKKGFYTDAYFNRTRYILERDNHHAEVLMQVFSRSSGILCGIDEAIGILKLCSNYPEKLKIKALYDGDSIDCNEVVMTIEGDYVDFAHLETVYLGVMARASSVATAVREAVEAANGKPVLFFSARFDHYKTQPVDGYAAIVGGAAGVSTDANGILCRMKGIGTIPHALIASYGGSTIKACEVFRKYMPEEVDLIALVDFDNDCIGTSLKVARKFGKRLWGVRVDTAGDLRDISVTPINTDSLGPCPELIWKLRRALDKEGFNHVKIIISGGFNADKIKLYVKLGVPFDAVGVGSSFYRKRIDFTADVVMVNGKHCAKVGREYWHNPRLEDVKM